MAIQHKDITGANVHEPKGIESAQNGLVYVANGTGSGTWKRLATTGIEGFPAGTPLANQVLTTNGTGGLQLGGTPIYGISQIRNTGVWGNTFPGLTTGVPPGSQSIVAASGMTLANGGLRATQAGVYRYEMHFQTNGGQAAGPNWFRMRLRKNGTTLTPNSMVIPPGGVIANENGSIAYYIPSEANFVLVEFISLAVTEYVEPVIEWLGNNTLRDLSDYRVQTVATLVR